MACPLAAYSHTHLLTHSLLPYNPPAICEAAEPDGAVRFRINGRQTRAGIFGKSAKTGRGMTSCAACQ